MYAIYALLCNLSLAGTSLLLEEGGSDPSLGPLNKQDHSIACANRVLLSLLLPAADHVHLSWLSEYSHGAA